ncbi:MAG: Dipeptide transport system permease protein DppB (TC 3.A.1.5.2) [Candidatus Burkholderia crenata]|nr:MAG: Dipeptide transport system permease protein DppB (TC 3.A.1.5.2) [Candidatus Burkholderia crenata]
MRHNRWIDHIASFIGLAGSSLSVFWLALMGLLLFYAKLHWVSGPYRPAVRRSGRHPGRQAAG